MSALHVEFSVLQICHRLRPQPLDFEDTPKRRTLAAKLSTMNLQSIGRQVCNSIAVRDVSFGSETRT